MPGTVAHAQCNRILRDNVHKLTRSQVHHCRCVHCCHIFVPYLCIDTTFYHKLTRSLLIHLCCRVYCRYLHLRSYLILPTYLTHLSIFIFLSFFFPLFLLLLLLFLSTSLIRSTPSSTQLCTSTRYPKSSPGKR